MRSSFATATRLRKSFGDIDVPFKLIIFSVQRILEVLSGINSPCLLNRYLHIQATFCRSTCTLETHISTTRGLLRTHAQDRLIQEIETQVARKTDQPTSLLNTFLRLKNYIVDSGIRDRDGSFVF